MGCTSTDDVRFFRSKKNVFVLRNLPGASGFPDLVAAFVTFVAFPFPDLRRAKESTKLETE